MKTFFGFLRLFFALVLCGGLSGFLQAMGTTPFVSFPLSVGVLGVLVFSD